MDRYIELYGARLYALCLKLCGNSWDAKDLYQDGWLRIYRAFHTYIAERDFFSWAAKIMVNVYRDRLRKEKLARFITFSGDGEKERFLDSLPAKGEEDYSDVHEAVSSLDEKYRLVIVLYYFLSKSVDQTARILHLSQGTVKSRLSRAREMLKRRLERDERQG